MPYVYKDGIPQCFKAGAYYVRNRINGKMYVGSSDVLTRRLLANRDCLRRGKHDNWRLQDAWDEFGEDAFEFVILGRCSPTDCLALEQKFMDELKSADPEYGYNLSPTAGSTKGYKWSPESCALASEIRKGKAPLHATAAAAVANRGRSRPVEICEKISRGLKGKPKTEAHKAKTKATHWSKGPNAAEIAKKSADKNRGKKHSEEHKAKIAEGNLRRWARYREEQSNLS